MKLLHTIRFVLVSVGVLLAASAAAHHSFASFFQMDTYAEVEGRVTRVNWVNPHILIYIEDDDGNEWEIEAGPVNLLSRMGIERSFIRVGDTIRARGNPGRRNSRALWVENILLSDNTELLANPAAQPYWESDAVGDASSFFVAGDLALAPGADPSLFRVWTPLISGMPRPAGAASLTAEGERAQAVYDIGNPMVGDCEVPGMPFAMMSPYPIELVDAGDRILLRGEAYDLERIIHLDASAAEPGATPLGYSVGRFEGGELIVETDRIDYHSYGDLGPAQSPQSRVLERFVLAPDGLGLSYEVTVTDPVMLAAPWRWAGAFIYRPDAARQPWRCGVER